MTTDSPDKPLSDKLDRVFEQYHAQCNLADTDPQNTSADELVRRFEQIEAEAKTAILAAFAAELGVIIPEKERQMLPGHHQYTVGYHKAIDTIINNAKQRGLL